MLLLLSASAVQAQQIFYKGFNGKLRTRAQVDSIFSVEKQRATTQGMVANLVINDKSQRKDTTFYRFSINKSPQPKTTAPAFDNLANLNRFVGKKLPAFALKDIKGKAVSSTALAGKPLVINMWFTTCGGCIEEMPELNRVLANPEYKNITFLSMTYEKKEKVLAFLKKRTFNFRAIAEAQAYCNQFTQEYPITIFVDRQGVVRSIQGGLPGIDKNLATERGIRHLVLSPSNSSYLDATQLYSTLDEIK